jgi:U3 small nucleolar RNA-associated protein 25
MPGVVEKIVPRVQQVFQRIECNSIADADDARFNYFVEKVFHLSEKVSSSSNFGG